MTIHRLLCVELANYGEALLNPHLLEILEYADSKAVAITFSVGVNLNHATDELLEGLVKCRVKTHYLLDRWLQL